MPPPPLPPPQLGGYCAAVATYLHSAYTIGHFHDPGEAGWPAALGRLSMFVMAVHVTLSCRRSVWWFSMGVSYTRLMKWHIYNGIALVICVCAHAGQMTVQRKKEDITDMGKNIYGGGPRLGIGALSVILFMLFMIHIRWKRYEVFFRVHQFGYFAVAVLVRAAHRGRLTFCLTQLLQARGCITPRDCSEPASAHTPPSSRLNPPPCPPVSVCPSADQSFIRRCTSTRRT